MGVESLRTRLGPLDLQSPIIACSGTWGYGTEQKHFSTYDKLGAFVSKGITLEPREGNPPPRLFESRGGLLNTIGLENVGVEAFVRDKVEALPDPHPPMIVNIAGESVDDYAQLAERLSTVPKVAALEVNVSCPNKEKGLVFGSDPCLVSEVTSAVKEKAGALPIIVKLTPNVTDITVIAQAAAEAGADSLAMINTVLGMAIDHKRKAPIFHRVLAGLSGPAIKPVGLAAVWRCYAALGDGLPIVGMGGVQTWLDALEFILAGATAVGVGTANFVDPLCCNSIYDGLLSYLKNEGISSVLDLVGVAHGK